VSKVVFLVKFFGRVQGVGFRMFVLGKANALGVTGWVRNMLARDEVDAVFCGEKVVVDSLIESLKENVGLIRVDRVIIEDFASSEEYSDFSIKY